MSTSFRLRDLPGWAAEMDEFYRGRNKWYGVPDWQAPSDLVFQLAGDIVVPVKPPAFGTLAMIPTSINFVEYIMRLRDTATDRVADRGFRVIRGGSS